MGQIGMPVTRDAVILVPGIMGSELVDVASGAILWGLRDPRWYVRAWTSGSFLAALQLTPEEREGHYGRIRANGLLRFPAFAPVLRGFEPYGRLLEGIRRSVVHPDAVAEFAYDWRLPVDHNARLLADALDRHSVAWRAHPEQVAARQLSADGGEAQIVIVAHSMGGLLARHVTRIPGAMDGVRAVVTLGTPFYGAVKAVVLMSSGRGGPLPLPHARLRELAAALPGVYDLLPTYRCVDLGSEARRISSADVAGLGGDRQLAEQAVERQARVSGASLPGHVQIVGTHQTTPQSLILADGIAIGHTYICRPGSAGVERVDVTGDGTVYRESAQLPGVTAMPLAQSHGAIAKSEEAVLAVSDALTERRTGPWLGAGEMGLDLPDMVDPGATFSVELSGVEHPRDASCRIVDTSSERIVGVVPLRLAGGGVAGQAVLPEPGLYRVEVTGGGASSLSQLLLAGRQAPE